MKLQAFSLSLVFLLCSFSSFSLRPDRHGQLTIALAAEELQQQAVEVSEPAVTTSSIVPIVSVSVTGEDLSPDVPNVSGEETEPVAESSTVVPEESGAPALEIRPSVEEPPANPEEGKVASDAPGDVVDSIGVEEHGEGDESDGNESNSTDVSEPRSTPVEVPSPPEAEDLPTFEEWKKKKEEEDALRSQENQSTQAPERVTPNGITNGNAHHKKQMHNYANVDCGAKVVAANNGAQNRDAVLDRNRDAYMLNPCSVKTWFVVELCDEVLLDSLELANFELFSSRPKNFTVNTAARYPTREWNALGDFQANDTRDVQSFPLEQRVYAKYVKVEIHSHHGEEHYCPISLVRIFATSMVEEYELSEAEDKLVDDQQAQDDDVSAQSGFEQNGLLSSAKDVVYSFLRSFFKQNHTAKENAEQPSEEKEDGPPTVVVDEVREEDTPANTSVENANESNQTTVESETVSGEEVLLPVNGSSEASSQAEENGNMSSGTVNSTAEIPSSEEPGEVGSARPSASINESNGANQVTKEHLKRAPVDEPPISSSTKTAESPATNPPISDNGGAKTVPEVHHENLATSLKSDVLAEPTPEATVNVSDDNVPQEQDGVKDAPPVVNSTDGQTAVKEPDSSPLDSVSESSNNSVTKTNVTAVPGIGNTTSSDDTTLTGDSNSTALSDTTAPVSVNATAKPNATTNHSTASNGSNGNSNETASVPVTGAPAKQEKESVFIRLNNRIKALDVKLDTNLSSIKDYLGELRTSFNRFKNNMSELYRASESRLHQLNDSLSQTQNLTQMSHSLYHQTQEDVANLAATVLVLTEEMLHMQEKMLARHQSFMLFALVIVAAAIVLFVFLATRHLSSVSEQQYRLLEQAMGQATGLNFSPSPLPHSNLDPRKQKHGLTNGALRPSLSAPSFSTSEHSAEERFRSQHRAYHLDHDSDGSVELPRKNHTSLNNSRISQPRNRRHKA